MARSTCNDACQKHIIILNIYFKYTALKIIPSEKVLKTVFFYKQNIAFYSFLS